MNNTSSMQFSGCKLALFFDDKLLVYLRDDKPDIVYPSLIDLPGGGREGQETPEQCVLRELHEEFSLSLHPSQLCYRHPYTIPLSNEAAFFFAAKVDAEYLEALSFGEEGQYFEWMSIDDYLNHDKVISHHKTQLRRYLEQLDLD